MAASTGVSTQSTAGNATILPDSSLLKASHPAFVIHAEADCAIPKIGVIAIGGAANSILRDARPHLQSLHKAIALDSNPFSINRPGVDRRLLVGDGINRSQDIREMQNQFAQIAEELKGETDDLDLVFTIVGLGGITGTALAPKVAEILSSQRIFHVSIGVTPFGFEGTRRQQIANAGLKAIQRRAAVTFEISNALLAREFTDTSSMEHALSSGPRKFEEIYGALQKPLTDCSLAGIDFRDVKYCLGGRCPGVFGTATSPSGSIQAATQGAIAEVEFNIDDLCHAKSIFVVIEGARGSLMMRDVQEAMALIKDKMNPEAHVIYSAHYEPSLEGRLRVSLLTSGPYPN